jgi:hypothetical protein
MRDVNGTYTVSNGNGKWRAVGAFTAPEAGTYTLNCPSNSVAALGPDPSISAVFGFVTGAIALGIGGPGLGLVIFLVVFTLRSASKRRQQRQLGLRP